MTVPGRMRPSASAASIMARPDAVLDRPERVEELELGEDFRDRAGGLRQFADAHQRRVADGLDDAVMDALARRGRIGERQGGDGRGHGRIGTFLWWVRIRC